MLDVSPTSDPLACLDSSEDGGRYGAAGGTDDAPASAATRLVLTADARQALSLLAPWFQQPQPVLLVGPEGSGKSTMLRSVTLAGDLGWLVVLSMRWPCLAQLPSLWHMQSQPQLVWWLLQALDPGIPPSVPSAGTASPGCGA